MGPAIPSAEQKFLGPCIEPLASLAENYWEGPQDFLTTAWQQSKNIYTCKYVIYQLYINTCQIYLYNILGRIRGELSNTVPASPAWGHKGSKFNPCIISPPVGVPTHLGYLIPQPRVCATQSSQKSKTSTHKFKFLQQTQIHVYISTITSPAPIVSWHEKGEMTFHGLTCLSLCKRIEGCGCCWLPKEESSSTEGRVVWGKREKAKMPIWHHRKVWEAEWAGAFMPEGHRRGSSVGFGVEESSRLMVTHYSHGTSTVSPLKVFEFPPKNRE